MKVQDFAPTPHTSSDRPPPIMETHSRPASTRSKTSSSSAPPPSPSVRGEEPPQSAQPPPPRPVSRLLSSSSKVPRRPSTPRAPASRSPSKPSPTSASASYPRPKNRDRTSSTASKQSSASRKPKTPNIAGPSNRIYAAPPAAAAAGDDSDRRDGTDRGSSFVVGGRARGGSTASEKSHSTEGEKPPVWGLGGVFPTKADRRRSSIARDWAKNREKERKELAKERDKNRRIKPERMESVITEHSSSVGDRVGDRGDGGLPSDTIVERADPFERFSASGEESDESRNGKTTPSRASKKSDMSRGGSTESHPVIRQDHEDSRREAEAGDGEANLDRKISPGSSTLAEAKEEEAELERNRQHDREYDSKVVRGRGQVEEDSRRSVEAQASKRLEVDHDNDDEDDQMDDEEDDRSHSGSQATGHSSAGSNAAQVGGQLNQNKEDWQDDMNNQDGPPIRNCWGTIRYALREPMAEFLGTLILVVLGVGAHYLLSCLQSTNTYFVWGFAVMISVYVAGGISGGHTNPAVTISLALFRGFPWKMVPRYILAQVFGAFCGALMIYGNYKRAINEYDPNHLIHASADPPLNASATLFFTAPAPSIGTTPLGFAQEILAGGILMIAVLALGDENNAPPGAGLGAIVLGFVVVAIGMSNGWVSGYAINPARDIGPRFALWVVGYGKQVWTHDDCWWIFGPLLGPLVGSIGGCLAYDMLIFNGPGSPVNWSAHELLASVKLPQMYRFAKHAAHPRTRHAQARAERDLEATLPPKVSVIRRAELTGRDRPGRRGSTERKDLEVVQRWRVGRERIEKQQEENRDKYVVARKRRVEQAKQEVKAKSDAIQDAFAAEIDNEEAMDTFAVRGKGDWAGREEEGKKE
ncbi:hypothetical protein JCM11491_004984 [Sporobolomyces phaffii]